MSPVKSKRTAEDYYPYLNDGDQPLEVKQQSHYIGDVSATTEPFLFTAPFDCRVIGVKITVDTTVAVDAVNYWTAQIENVTRERELLSSADTLNAVTAITADQPTTLTPDQNDEMTEGDALLLILTKVASASNLGSLLIEVMYVASGEATTTSSSTSSSTSTSTSTTTTSSSTSTTTTSSSTTTTSSSTTVT